MTDSGDGEFKRKEEEKIGTSPGNHQGLGLFDNENNGFIEQMEQNEPVVAVEEVNQINLPDDMPEEEPVYLKF